MGLDQYAHRLVKKHPEETFMEAYRDQLNAPKEDDREWEELAYWRKHPNLQGWMEERWRRARKAAKALVYADGEEEEEEDEVFNTIPFQLDEALLDELEADVNSGKLPPTAGFFFGQDSDEFYKEKDLSFIRKAREALANGDFVFYYSWW